MFYHDGPHLDLPSVQHVCLLAGILDEQAEILHLPKKPSHSILPRLTPSSTGDGEGAVPSLEKPRSLKGKTGEEGSGFTGKAIIDLRQHRLI